MSKVISYNPATVEDKIGEIECSTKSEISTIVSNSNKVKSDWKFLPIKKKIDLLKMIYEKFSKRKKEIAQLITTEIGKPINESIVELEKGLVYFKYYLDNAEQFLRPNQKTENGIKHSIKYIPYGTTAVILPWNFPFMLFIWGVIPTLLSGNTVVLKHSELCPLTGKLLEEIISDSTLPNFVFQEIYGGAKQGRILVNNNINFIWFTGSSKTGQFLFKLAGKKFIPSLLEMGGSNPAIIFDDYKLKANVNKVFRKRFANCGQYCTAVKRLIVHKSVFNEVVTELKKLTETIKIGNPNSSECEMGPLASFEQRKVLMQQINKAREKGANVITGGKIPENLKGAYYLPTIVTKISCNMKIWKEETFGPVLPIVSFQSEEEAIELANDTIYGLGAQVYTKDIKQAERVADRINAGMIEINQGKTSSPSNPFGGCKLSGIGREHGVYGFKHLTQIKLISQ
ncbi:aldehyde dehydrogenase family protein [Candidatus Dojkabacteria bacterium]|nr:aldehyde dehydrogenase family protein [Candidatus Dojkabacteria bacterium]